jgi:hypothetical protein
MFTTSSEAFICGKEFASRGSYVVVAEPEEPCCLTPIAHGMVVVGMGG